MFTYEDLHQVTFSVYLERRLIRYLQTFRTALTQLYYNRNSLSRRLRNFGQSIFGFTPAVKQIDRPPPLPVDCVLKGMGLIVAVQERRSSFYIYFLQPQHSHLLRIHHHHQHYDSEPADIAVFIRGPQGDYGEVIIQHLNPSKSSNYKSLHFSATKSSCNIPINYRLTARYIRINYMPQSPGTHELAILRRGYHLPGSPFLVTVDMRSQYAVPQTYAFSDDEQCSKNKANRRRLRVMFRVVDFISEKMLLTEDGRLEKLPVLVSERILAYRSSQTSSDRTCSSPDSVDSADEPIQRLKQLKHYEPSNVFKTSPTKIAKDYKNVLRGRWRKVMLLCRFFAKQSSDQRRLQILKAAGHIFDGRPVRLTESTLKLIEEAVSAIPSDKDDFGCQIAIDEITNESITLESDVNINTESLQYETCATFSNNDNEMSNLDVPPLEEASKTVTQDQSMEGLRELYKSSSNVGLNLIAHLEDEKDKGAITTRRIACSQYRKDATSTPGKVTTTEFEEMETEVPKINCERVCGDQSLNTAKSEQTNRAPNTSAKYVRNKTEKQRLENANDKSNLISHIPDVKLIANEEGSVELELKTHSGERRDDSDKDEQLGSSKHGAQPNNRSAMKEVTISKCSEYNVYDSDQISTDKHNKQSIAALSEDQCHSKPKQMSHNTEENLQYRDGNVISDDETKQNDFSKDTASSISEFPNENLHEITSATNNETRKCVTERATNTSKEKGILPKQSKIQKECPSAAVQAMIRRFESLQKETSIDLVKEKVNSDVIVDNKEMQDILCSEGKIHDGEEDVNTKENKQPTIKSMNVHQCADQLFERQSTETTSSDLENKTTKNQTKDSNFADVNTLGKEETVTCNSPPQLTASSQRTGETRYKDLKNIEHSQHQEKCYQAMLVETKGGALLCSGNGTTVPQGHAHPTALPKSGDRPRGNETEPSQEKVQSDSPARNETVDKNTLERQNQNTVDEPFEQHNMDVSKSISSNEISLPCKELPKPRILETQLVNSDNLQTAPAQLPSCSYQGLKTMNNATNSSDDTSVVEESGNAAAKEESTKCKLLCNNNEYCVVVKEENEVSNNHIQESALASKETDLPIAVKVSTEPLEKCPATFIESNADNSTNMTDIDIDEGSSTTIEQTIYPDAITKKAAKILKELDGAIVKKADTENVSVSQVPKTLAEIPKHMQQTHSGFLAYTNPDQSEENSTFMKDSYTNSVLRPATTADLKRGVETLKEENLTHPTPPVFTQLTESKALLKIVKNEAQSTDSSVSQPVETTRGISDLTNSVQTSTAQVAEHENDLYSECAMHDTCGAFTKADAEPANEVQNRATEEANKSLKGASAIRGECGTTMKEGQEENLAPLLDLHAANEKSLTCVKEPHKNPPTSVFSAYVPETTEKCPQVSTLIPLFTEPDVFTLNDGKKSSVTNEESVAVLEDSRLKHYKQTSDLKEDDFKTSTYNATDFITENNNESCSFSCSPSSYSILPNNFAKEIPDITTVPYVRSFEDMSSACVDSLKESQLVVKEAGCTTDTDSLAVTENDQDSSILNKSNTAMEFSTTSFEKEENSASALAVTEESIPPLHEINTECSLSQVVSVQDEKDIEPLIWSSAFTVNENADISENAFATVIEESQDVLSVMEVETSTSLSVTLAEQGPLILDTSTSKTITKTNTVIKKDSILSSSDTSTFKDKEGAVATEGFEVLRDEVKITQASVPSDMSEENDVLLKGIEHLCLNAKETAIVKENINIDSLTSLDLDFVEATDEFPKGAYAETFVATSTDNVEEIENNDSLLLYFDANEDIHTLSKDLDVVIESSETPILYEEQNIIYPTSKESQTCIWRPSDDKVEETRHVFQQIHKESSSFVPCEDRSLLMNESRATPKEETSALIQVEDAIIAEVFATQLLVEDLTLEESNIEFCTSVSSVRDEKCSTSEDVDVVRLNIDESSLTVRQPHITQPSIFSDNVEQSELVLPKTDFGRSVLLLEENIHITEETSSIVDLHKNAGKENTSIASEALEVSRDLLSGNAIHHNVATEATCSAADVHKIIDTDDFGLPLWDTQIYNAKDTPRTLQAEKSDLQNQLYFPSKRDASEDRQKIPKGGKDSPKSKRPSNLGQADIIAAALVNEANCKSRSSPQDLETRGSENCSGFSVSDANHKYDLLNVLGLSNNDNIEHPSCSISTIRNEPITVDSINSALDFRCREETNKNADSLDLLQGVNSESYSENAIIARDITVEPYIRLQHPSQYVQQEISTAKVDVRDPLEKHSAKMAANPEDKFAYNPWTTPLICSTAVSRKQPVVIEEKIACNPWSTAVIEETRVLGLEDQITHSSLLLDDASVSKQCPETCDQVMEIEEFVSDTLTCVSLETVNEDNDVAHNERQYMSSPSTAAETASKIDKPQCEVESAAPEDWYDVVEVHDDAADLKTCTSTIEDFINQEFIRDLHDLHYKQHSNNSIALYESNLAKNKSTECNVTKCKNKVQCADFSESLAEENKDQAPKIDTVAFSLDDVSAQKLVKGVGNNVVIGIAVDTKKQDQGTSTKNGIEQAGESFSKRYDGDVACDNLTRINSNIANVADSYLNEVKKDVPRTDQTAKIITTGAFADDGGTLLNRNNVSLSLSNSNAALNSNILEAENEKIGIDYSQHKLSPFEDVKIVVIPPSPITDAVSSSTSNDFLTGSLIEISSVSEDSTTPVSKSPLSKLIEDNYKDQASCLNEDEGLISSEQNKHDNFPTLSTLTTSGGKASPESIGSISDSQSEISNLDCSENNDNLDFFTSRTINAVSVIHDSLKHAENENTSVNKNARCYKQQLEIDVNLGETQHESDTLNLPAETSQGNISESQNHHCSSLETSIPRTDRSYNANMPTINVEIKEYNLVGSGMRNDEADAHISPQKEDNANRCYPPSTISETTKKCVNNTEELKQHQKKTANGRMTDTPQSNWDDKLLPSENLIAGSTNTLDLFNSNQNGKQCVSEQPVENEIKSINYPTAKPQNKELAEGISTNFDSLEVSSRNEDGISTEALRNQEYSDTDCDTQSQQAHIYSVEPEWIDAPYFACRESTSVSHTHNAQGRVYETQNCDVTEPENTDQSTCNTFPAVRSSRTPEEVRLLEATLLDIEDSAGFCNELGNDFINSTGKRETILEQETEYFELSLDNLQNEHQNFKVENQNSNLNVLLPVKFSTLELTNPSIAMATDGHDDDTTCNELYPTSFESCGSNSGEVHAACFTDGAMACAILDTQPVFASGCPLLAPEDGPVLASSPSQNNVEKGTSFFPDLDDLLSKDFTTYMSSSGDQFHLWPSDVAFGSPSSNLDENIDFDSVLAAPNLEEALRKLEHDIQKRKEEQVSDSSPEEKSEGEAPDDKSVSADAENEDLSSSPSIAWNGDDNNLVEEVNMEEEEEENLPDQANGPAEEENLSYDIGDSDYVSLDDIQSSFKHSPESRDTDDSRNDSSYSGGQREGENEGAASCRNRKLRSFEYSQEEREFRHMQGGSNAVISGFMGPAEREIWGIVDGNGDDKDKPRECAVSMDSDTLPTEKQGTSQVDHHYDTYDQDSDEEEEESEIDWAAALSNVRCYPRVLSPGSGPTMSAIVEENEEESSVTRSSSAQLSKKKIRAAKKGSDGDMTNTVSETREELMNGTNTIPHCNVEVNCAEEHQARTSNQGTLQSATVEQRADTINKNVNSMCLSLTPHKPEIENEPEESLQNIETTADISNSGLSNTLELPDDRTSTINECSPDNDISKLGKTAANINVVGIKNTNNGELLKPLCVDLTKSKVQVLKALFEKDCSANESGSETEPVKAVISHLNPENKGSLSGSIISKQKSLHSNKGAVKYSKNATNFEDKTEVEGSFDHIKHLTRRNNESNDQQLYEQHLETPLISFYTNVKKRSNTPENRADVTQPISFGNEGVHSVADDCLTTLEMCDGIVDTDRPTMCKAYVKQTTSDEIPEVVTNRSIKSTENKDVTQKICDFQSSTSKNTIVTTSETRVEEILPQEDALTEKFASTVDEIFSEILQLDSLDSTEVVDDKQATRETGINELVIHTQPIITVTEPTNDDLDDAAQMEGENTVSQTQLAAVGKCIARRRQYWDDILRLAIEQKDIQDKGKLSPQGIQESPGLTHSEIYRKLCRRNKFAALRSRKPISVRVHGIVNKWRLAFETLKFLEESESQSGKQTERQPGSNKVEQWKKYWDNLVEEQAQIARYKELSKEEITKQYKTGEKRTLHVSGVVAVGRERFEKISSEPVDKKYKDPIRKRRPRRLERSINSASPSPERNSKTNQSINIQPFVMSSSPDSANTAVTNLFNFNENVTSDVPEHSEESVKTTKCNSLTFKATVTQFEKEENLELPVVEIEDTSSTIISVNKVVIDELEELSSGHSSTVTPQTEENVTTERKNIEKDPETKNRFQKAKQFFQMLEQNNPPSKDSNPAGRRRTGGFRKGKSNIAPSNSRETWDSTLSLVEPSREFPYVRPSSVSSAPAYDTWGSIQSLEDKEPCKEGLRSSPSSSTESLSRCLSFKKLRSPIGGSERCAKVYEKFHVEDLFKDVVGECGRNCGSLKGIPHQQAVLASLQSVGDRCLSPYDEVGSAATSDDEQPYESSMATSPLPQGYLPEYPYLSTTPARLYRPRSSLVGSSLISRKDLLSVDKTTNF